MSLNYDDDILRRAKSLYGNSPTNNVENPYWESFANRRVQAETFEAPTLPAQLQSFATSALYVRDPKPVEPPTDPLALLVQAEPPRPYPEISNDFPIKPRPRGRSAFDPDSIAQENRSRRQDSLTLDESEITQPINQRQQDQQNYQKVRDFLEPDPDYEYGDILPLRSHKKTKELELAVPNAVRETGKGLFDLIMSPHLGKLTPDAKMGLFTLATGGAFALRRASRVAAKGLNGSVDDLIAGKTKSVKVGTLTDTDIQQIMKVVPSETGALFREADGSIRASKGLLDSLIVERPKDAERLVRRMPDLLNSGELRGNHTNTNRVVKLLPHATKKGYFDVMVMDVVDAPGKIGVPTIMTSPKRTIIKFPKP